MTHVDDWVLFLGAGASVGPPTRLPLFLPLAEGILRSMGWRPGAVEDEPAWIHSRYPPFADPDLSAEVLLGALRRFGVEFIGELADLFAVAPPGAVHQVAASVLGAGGSVWTTNVDVAVEAACAERGFAPTLIGRAADRAPAIMRPLRAADEGSYVKLHGTAAVAATMAFTDRELMSPLAAADVEHLGAMADGRVLVVYGYAAADADLADLLDEALRLARRVIWFEPFERVRGDIARAFRHADRIEFKPKLTGVTTSDLQANADDFLTFARQQGARVEGREAAALRQIERLPGPPSITLDAIPGIAQARLVERFGKPETHADALRAARVDDLLGRRWETVEGHLRWTIARSLYNAGAMSRLVRWLARHRALLARLRPKRLRDYFITRSCGLRLRDDGWEALGDFVEWAIATRARPEGTAYPSDLYYRAQARRYDLRPALAGQDADAAVRGLADRTVADPERLAGALLESGMCAVYEGRFEDALARGFDLQFRRGRYAIQVWRGWGAWLQVIAYCHMRRPGDALRELEEVEHRFRADGRPVLLADLRSARLLTLRVAIAAGGEINDELLGEARAADVKGRYRDDLDLVLADLAIAVGDRDDAQARLLRVDSEARSPLASAMADLGLAEIERLDGEREAAARRFAALAGLCRSRGAMWLEAQALLGLTLCGSSATEERWPKIRANLSDAAAPEGSLESLAFGEPRVLWMLTI